MCRSEVLGSLCSGGQEGCGRIYHCLSQLLCLCELEEAGGEPRCVKHSYLSPLSPSLSASSQISTIYLYSFLPFSSAHLCLFLPSPLCFSGHDISSLSLSLLPTSQTSTSPASPTNLTFLTSWQDRLKHFDTDFRYLEPVLSLRVSTLHSLLLRERQTAASGRGQTSSLNLAGRRRTEQLFGALSDTLLTLAKRAQDVGRYQVNI